MKKSVAETAATRKRIVSMASREICTNGIEGTAIIDLMKAAGLTKGGFYRHFDSKDQLVAEACAEALGSMIAQYFDSKEELKGKRKLTEFFSTYLSPRNRDNPGGGCPLAALGSELARAPKATRNATSKGFSHLVEAIVEQYDGRKDVARRKALATISALVGGLTMARAVNDPALSSEILAATQKELIQAL